MIKITIDPPLLLSLLSQEERDTNVMLIDLEADKINRSNIRLNLNVIFKTKVIRRGKIKKTNWYIGTTGGEVNVLLPGTQVVKYADGNALKVNYSNTIEGTRTVGLDIKPVIKTEKAGSKSEISFGGITYDKGSKYAYLSTFEGTERTLAVINEVESISWIIDLPRGGKVVRDFLIGNLYLYADFNMRSLKLINKCRLMIRPSNISLFNSKKIEMDRAKSILMLHYLRIKGYSIKNPDGFDFTFTLQI